MGPTKFGSTDARAFPPAPPPVGESRDVDAGEQERRHRFMPWRRAGFIAGVRGEGGAQLPTVAYEQERRRGACRVAELTQTGVGRGVVRQQQRSHLA